MLRSRFGCHGIDSKSIITRYLEKSSKSGSCILITKVGVENSEVVEVVGMILTLDEFQNWGPGVYAIVIDVLLSNSFTESSECFEAAVL